MNVTIVDYKSGNISSVINSFKEVAQNKIKIEVTSDINKIKSTDKVVLPGQGSFKSCVDALQSIKGLVDCLNEFVINKKKPLLGICVGLQMFADVGYEESETKGLGWISGKVTKIDNQNGKYKLPHIGWNQINIVKNGKILFNVTHASKICFVPKKYNQDEYILVDSVPAGRGFHWSKNIRQGNFKQKINANYIDSIRTVEYDNIKVQIPENIKNIFSLLAMVQIKQHSFLDTRWFNFEQEGSTGKARFVWSDTVTVEYSNKKVLCDHYRLDIEIKKESNIYEKSDYFLGEILAPGMVKQLWVSRKKP